MATLAELKAAAAQKASKAPPAAAEAPAGGQALNIPWSVTMRRPAALGVILVGCGGTGARIAALLPKVLRRGDSIQLFDDDVVEERNLTRQHFVNRDVGRPKVEVVASRLAQECERVGIILQHHNARFNGFNGGPAMLVPPVGNAAMRQRNNEPQPFPQGMVCIGASDNKAARQAMYGWTYDGVIGRAWIDAGNEMRGGQVLLSTKNWPVWEWSDSKMVASTFREGAVDTRYATCDAVAALYPALIEAEQKAMTEVECGGALAALDLQTVTANNLAAAWVATMLSWICDEIPTSVGGISFSTLGTVQTHSFREGKTGNYSTILELTPK